MAFSIAHDLISAIIAECQAAAGTGLYVSDGFFVSADGSDVLMVGVSDIDGNGESVEGEVDFATTGLDGMHQESGSILCVALSWNGDGDQFTAREAVFDIANMVAELCRIKGGTDPAFGVERALWTTCGRSFSLDQPATADGAVAILKFRIYYEGRP